MLFRQKKSLIEYLDVSVLISYPEIEREQQLFHAAMAGNCRFFQRNGVEVILVTMGGIGSIAAAYFPERYPFVNWKIVRCAGDHPQPWQVRIAAAMTHAENAWIFVLESGVLLQTDVLYRLRYLSTHYQPCYLVGASEEGVIGGLMIQTAMIRQVIRGLGQERDLGGWCKRMGLLDSSAGLSRLDVPEAAVRFLYQRDECRQDVLVPAAGCNSELVQTWRSKHNRAALASFMLSFEASWLCAEEVTGKQYGIVGLISVRDEIRHLPDVLLNMEQVCDGIILLDDGSLDESFEAACSGKLLLKVKKKRTKHFDDLTNRNLLLQFGHFFNAGWFFFMDADERFDPRYADLRAITKLGHIDVAGFKLVHIWDSPDCYRRDLPEGKRGILNRYRMFRNKGYMQIKARNELHFKSIPFKKNVLYSRVLVLHYGLMEKNVRERKFRLYSGQDRDGKQQGFSYEYLLDENIDAGKVSEIAL